MMYNFIICKDILLLYFICRGRCSAAGQRRTVEQSSCDFDVTRGNDYTDGVPYHYVPCLPVVCGIQREIFYVFIQRAHITE